MTDQKARKKRILKNRPGYIIIEIGDYHGVISIFYTENGRYEEEIRLSLMGGGKEPFLFYANMSYNETYTGVNSIFGYRYGQAGLVKKVSGSTALYEISDKYESSQPITLPVFIDLVTGILKDEFNIKGTVISFSIPKNKTEKYFAQKSVGTDVYPGEQFLNYFYVSRSVFRCLVNRSEELVIDDYNFPEFPEILTEFTWLRKLELYELLVSEIPEELTGLSNLRSLSLKLKFLAKLPAALQRLSRLEYIKIERTGLTGIPENLFELVSLKELHIINNRELAEIPEEIVRLSLLEFLYIYGNKLSSLPGSITGLKKLRVLHLANNMIEYLPEELTALPNLRVLNLGNNRLKTIPERLFEMESLREVVLSNNPILDKGEVYGLLMKSNAGNRIKLIF